MKDTFHTPRVADSTDPTEMFTPPDALFSQELAPVKFSHHQNDSAFSVPVSRHEDDAVTPSKERELAFDNHDVYIRNAVNVHEYPNTDITGYASSPTLHRARRPSPHNSSTAASGFKLSREAVIRRVIVDGRDDKDYFSRSVTLPLRENGVYEIDSTENVRKRKGGQQKLPWKFKYLVEERRHALTNEVIPTEKILRPICFVCSPELLLPSQAITVTMAHLLSKSFRPSLVAKRVTPPAMPTPVTAIATPLESTMGGILPNNERRRSRVGSVVKSLSRPTTPATDRRLRGTRTRGSSFASGSLPITPQTSVTRPDLLVPSAAYPTPGSSSLQAPSHHGSHVNLSTQSAPDSGRPSTARKGLMLDWDPPETMKQLFVPRARRASESSSKKPRSVGNILGKSPKLLSGALFTRPRSNSRPATAGTERSQFSFDHGFSQYTLTPAASDIPPVPVPPLPWLIPTDDEVFSLLGRMAKVVNKEQERLENLARMHNSREARIERVDSSGDLSVISSTPGTPRQPTDTPFTLRPIASFKTLERIARNVLWLPSDRRPRVKRTTV
ncbi:SubName: Full=Uncharacterized protein {ECO:0000313/EMBL:CCA78088.1} [Serendipita indica DSM 11827]|nr:SubName: Full=Uncharacterized protein {ECO:0000313/EMBL:CCA78088.1} [Serendipita indica DSM 11827]